MKLYQTTPPLERHRPMKHLLLTTIAAVVLVGCRPPPPDISIHDAVEKGNVEAVKRYLNAGGDLEAKGGGGKRTPLHGAAMFGRKEIAELLIAKGADVNAKNYGEWTPLHLAAGEGHKEVAELLIASGVDVNAKADGELTPLHFAADKGHKEVVELLIAKGADVNFKHMMGQTPLDMASGKTANLLRKHGGKTGEELKAAGKSIKRIAEAATPEPPKGKAPDISIHAAVQLGYIEAVKQHLASGTDVNAKMLGWTPSHEAAYHGRKEIAELLIANGADVNAKVVSGPNQGKTPLDLAIEYNHTEIADLLRKHGGKTGEELEAEGK